MILLAGDSWGCGEWGPIGGPGSMTDETILHNGLTSFLLNNGFNVINLSQSGGSNLLTLSVLKNFLISNHQITKNLSHIFVFQTDWYRDLSSVDLLSEKSIQVKHRLILDFYNKLNYLGQDNNKKIYLLGGQADVIMYPEFKTTFNNLVIACQSSVNYVLRDNSVVDNPTPALYTNTLMNQFKNFKQNASTEELNEIVNDLELGQKRDYDLAHNPDFFTSHHGNRNFHKKLYDYIKLNYLEKD